MRACGFANGYRIVKASAEFSAAICHCAMRGAVVALAQKIGAPDRMQRDRAGLGQRRISVTGHRRLVEDLPGQMRGRAVPDRIGADLVALA